MFYSLYITIRMIKYVEILKKLKTGKYLKISNISKD